MAKVVVFSLKNWFIHQLWEKTIAKNLELNGHEVVNILSTKPLGGDDLRGYGNYDHLHALIGCKTGEDTSKYFNLKNTFEISDFFSQIDLQNALTVLGKAEYNELKTLEYKGIKVGKLCRTSTVRQAHSTDEDSEIYQRIFRDNVSTALPLIDAYERILQQFNPDVVFCVNGIFFGERILVEICKQIGKKIVTYERGAKPDTLYITEGEPINLFNFNGQWNKYKDKALTTEELKEVVGYLNDRRTSRNTTQKFQDLDTDDLEKTKTLIKYEELKKQNKHIISMFTNVMWDTAAVDKDTIFDNVLDWCIKTIKHTKEDQELFIRIHPADARYWGFEGAKQLQDEILKVIPELPKNVHLIKSQEKVNSYCLAELSDVCVVYTSQIGGEIAALGRPLIIAGEAFYRNKGFGYAPESQAEYFQRLGDKDLEANKDEALKYEHFLYFKMHYPFNIIQEDSIRGMGVVKDIKFMKKEGNEIKIDLSLIKNDVDLKRIREYVLEGIKDEYDVKEYVVQ